MCRFLLRYFLTITGGRNIITAISSGRTGRSWWPASRGRRPACTWTSSWRGTRHQSIDTLMFQSLSAVGLTHIEKIEFTISRNHEQYAEEGKPKKNMIAASMPDLNTNSCIDVVCICGILFSCVPTQVDLCLCNSDLSLSRTASTSSPSSGPMSAHETGVEIPCSCHRLHSVHRYF